MEIISYIVLIIAYKISRTDLFQTNGRSFWGMHTLHMHVQYTVLKIGEELNLANWRIKTKSPIFYLANLFCTCLTQNLSINYKSNQINHK